MLVQNGSSGSPDPWRWRNRTDETIETGLVREIQEETGITVTIERLTGVNKDMPRGIIALIFRCTPPTDQPDAPTKPTKSPGLPRPRSANE
jgi:ADP-ribose pyrophosphatase YjhB (NUDIX family)